MDFLLYEATISLATGAGHEQTDPPEPLTGFQGQGGIGCGKGRLATLAELAKRFDLHANQIASWKEQLVASAASAFGREAKAEPAVDLKTLHAKIGALTLENDFLR